MMDAGYADNEIPTWVKRPTEEQLATRATKAGESTESTEANQPPAALEPKEALPIGQSSLVTPPGSVGSVGSAGLTEEQVRLLGQANIRFFNNSWSKVTALPSGGYSVVPVEVRAELMKLEMFMGARVTYWAYRWGPSLV